jgi:hypothetical protein
MRLSGPELSELSRTACQLDDFVWSDDRLIMMSHHMSVKLRTLVVDSHAFAKIKMSAKRSAIDPFVSIRD